MDVMDDKTEGVWIVHPIGGAKLVGVFLEEIEAYRCAQRSVGTLCNVSFLPFGSRFEERWPNGIKPR